MKPFRKILAATDFGESSSLAVEHATDLAQRYGAELVIVHSSEAHPHGDMLAGTMLAQGGTGMAGAKLGLLNAVERAQETVPATRGELLEGNAADGVLAFAEANGIDLIVVGTHGRHRAARLVLGSVAEKIVRGCRVPVLTVYDTEARAAARLAGDADTTK